MEPTLRWELRVALGVGAVLAVLAALFPVWPDYGSPPPVRGFVSGIAIAGECLGLLWDDRNGVTVGKFVAGWLFYAALVFLPFRVESLLLHDQNDSSVRPPHRDSKILRTSIPMLTLAFVAYYRCRFGERPGGMDAGLGDEIAAEWLAPLMAIGLVVVLAALAHLLWRRLRARPA
jgi:hypothetical protein